MFILGAGIVLPVYYTLYAALLPDPDIYIHSGPLFVW